MEETYINNSWQNVLQSEFSEQYFKDLQEFLKQEYSQYNVCPAKEHIYSAFELTPYEEVKVVIMGQDPYHGKNQAHGLGFSVLPGVEIPPSLQRIYEELENDLGYPPVSHGFLESWAKQGVLLLDTVLTVREGEKYSHQGRGWETFTDAVIKKLSEREKPIVFILWGGPAKIKRNLINQRHVIIGGPHPIASVYTDDPNYEFRGTKPFSKANAALVNLRETPIDWQLPATT